MSAHIPLLGPDPHRTDQDPYEYAGQNDKARGYGYKQDKPFRLSPTGQLYAILAAVFLLGAGLDALRAHWASSGNNTSPGPLAFDSSKLAVILEPRNEPVLIPVLQNFFANLPPAWPVEMHTSPATAAFLRQSAKIKPHLASGKFRIKLLPNKGRDVHDGTSLSKYLASSSAFWDLLAPAEHILFFQTDTVLCSKSSFNVDDFLGLNDTRTGGAGYAWVGAVWPSNGYPFHPWGGNGGLSIRRRSIMHQVTTDNEWNGYENEDGWFVARIAEAYPDYSLFPEQYSAMRFSFENQAGDAAKEDWVWQPHGMHLGTGWWPCAWGLWEQVAKLQDWCPEVNVILPRECHATKEQLGH